MGISARMSVLRLQNGSVVFSLIRDPSYLRLILGFMNDFLLGLSWGERIFLTWWASKVNFDVTVLLEDKLSIALASTACNYPLPIKKLG